jgi:pullulanase/glycogen debranching enzyme
MALEDWHDAHRHALALWLAPRDDAAVLLLMNAEDAPVRFVLPPGAWVQRLDSARGDTGTRAVDGLEVQAPASGLLVLVSEAH